MNDIKDRIKMIRKELNKTQEEFGTILGITREGVASIESGRRNVTEKHIKFLCIAPIQGKYINENYIRTGQGDMFLQLPEEDEFAGYVEDLLTDGGDNELYNIIKAIMRTYKELSPKSQEVLVDTIAKFSENLKKERED